MNGGEIIAPDLEEFRFDAVIDWLDVRVTFDRPTQPRHVRQRIEDSLPHWGEPPYVKSLSGCPSGTTHSIVFRVQNPTGPAALMRDVQHVRPPGNRPLVETDVSIVNAEIALDLYHAAHDRDALVWMCLHMLRFRARNPAGYPIIASEGHFRGAADPQDVRQALSEGLSINSRADTGELYRVRYYVKSSDKMGKVRRELPAVEHRARMEAILLDSRCPFSTIESWRQYKFESLAPWFGLRALTPPKSESIALYRKRIMRFGVEYDPRKTVAHRRQHRRGTIADERWNSRARDALRKLTRSQGPGAGIWAVNVADDRRSQRQRRSQHTKS